MSDRNWVFTFAALALGLYLFAIGNSKFVHSEFVLPKLKSLSKVGTAVDAPCDPLCTEVAKQLRNVPLGGLLESGFVTQCKQQCEKQADGKVGQTRDKVLDHLLGGYHTPQGEAVSWATCMEEEPPKKKKSKFENCLENWIEHRVDIPRGDQSYTQIVQRVFENHFLLGFLMVFFTAVFPFLRTIFCLMIAIEPAEKVNQVHKMVSKFSMTEVLMVAILITFIKAESFSVYMSLGVGSYAFVVATICLWIAELRVGFLLGEKS